MIFKLVMALLTGAIGFWRWSQANSWRASGVIPAIWDESGQVTGRDQRGFKPFIIWTKALATLSWIFCAMCVASLIFGLGES